jgi:hypothetical protein
MRIANGGSFGNANLSLPIFIVVCSLQLSNLKFILMNCSPKSFSRGNALWQVPQGTLYCRAKTGIASGALITIDSNRRTLNVQVKKLFNIKYNSYEACGQTKPANRRGLLFKKYS